MDKNERFKSDKIKEMDRKYKEYQKKYKNS